MSQGTLFIVSAPSGAGKTSLVQALVARDERVRLSVSHTTRAPRPGEENGQHYHFVDEVTFREMIDQGAFIEHAQVFDNFYGTSRDAVTRPMDEGLDVVLEIDWQGAEQVRRQFPEALSVFILPPGRDALRQRLQGRGQDPEEVIERRMRDAVAEMSHYGEFDYLIVNDDFEQAAAELEGIVTTQRLRCCAQSARHFDLIRSLLGND
ncbi:MAG: guanylate kinase [Halothiobacillaceae bacterium]